MTQEMSFKDGLFLLFLAFVVIFQEADQLCNFGGGHYEEHSFEIT